MQRLLPTRWSGRFNKIHGALRTVHVSLNNAHTCPQMLKKAQWPPNNSSNLNGIEISCLGSDAYSQWAKPYQKLQIIYPKQSALDQVTHSGPDLRGGQGPGPQASHQQRASHQTRYILFVVHASCLRLSSYALMTSRI